MSADRQPTTPFKLLFRPLSHYILTSVVLLLLLLLLLLAGTSSTSASTCFDSARFFMHPWGSLLLNLSPLEGWLATLLACYFKRIFCFATAGSIRKRIIMPLPFHVSALVLWVLEETSSFTDLSPLTPHSLWSEANQAITHSWTVLVPMGIVCLYLDRSDLRWGYRVVLTPITPHTLSCWLSLGSAPSGAETQSGLLLTLLRDYSPPTLRQNCTIREKGERGGEKGQWCESKTGWWGEKQTII